MGLASLVGLHRQFTACLESKTYLTCQTEGAIKIETSPDKTTRLKDVFQNAQALIQATFDQSDEREAQITELRKLQTIGDDLYTKRYVQSTQSSWLRWFIRGVAKYTPSKLKCLLSRFLSNPYPKAEEETRRAHEAYKNLLKLRISALEKQIKDEENIRYSLEKIHENVEKLNQFDEHTLSLQEYKSTLRQIDESIHALLESYPTVEQSRILQKTGLTEDAFKLFHEQHESLPHVLNTENHRALQTLLQSTAWSGSFAQTLQRITFVIQKVGREHVLLAKNEQQQHLKDHELHNYKGLIKITKSLDPLTTVKELHVLIEKQPKCRPGAIEIELSSDQHLTPKFFQILGDLKKQVPEISLKGLKTLDCKTLAPSKAKAKKFMLKHLEMFKLPEVETVILNDHTLALVPMLKGLFPALNCMDLRDCKKVKDQNLKTWNQSGYLHSIHTLKLEGTSLTTDSLTDLMELPCLAQLTLPDLPQGRLPLSRLPQLDNPFRVKLFYTASRVTRPLISQLYTGPFIWAPVFQIPAARAAHPQEDNQVFSEKHTTLDPTSVAYWLHKSEYRLLRRQTAVHTILADFNANINDTNLVEFVQKFPNAKTISLYGCLHITNKGIQDLLSDCPEIESLDLTACRDITPGISAFFPGKNILMKQQVLKIENSQLTSEDALEEILAGRTLNELSTIDLTGCTDLTDEMLGKLLGRLNTDERDERGRKNPQRLNLAFLNLTGCTKITVKAFDDKQTKDGKWERKLLESLSQIVIKDCPNLNVKKLQKLYSNVLFSEKHEPVTLFIDPNRALPSLAYPSLPLPYLVNYRSMVELFPADCKNQALAQTVLRQPVDNAQLTAYDFTISLRQYDNTPLFTFPIHRAVLYSHSLAFRDLFRPGGVHWGNRPAAYTMINQHATEDIVNLMRDLLSGHAKIADLPWRQAAHLAELFGPKIFKMPHFYQQLLQRIHQQFNLDEFDDMVQVAFMLNDKEGLNQYEEELRSQVIGNEEDDVLMSSIATKISKIEAERERI
jgi:hypothetical protein